MSFTRGSHTCAVHGCNTKQHKMYQFPNPRSNFERFQKWVEAAGNPKFEDLSTHQIFKRGFICRRHFQDSDVRRNGSEKLLRSAVPSLNLPISKPFIVINLCYDFIFNEIR